MLPAWISVLKKHGFSDLGALDPELLRVRFRGSWQSTIWFLRGGGTLIGTVWRRKLTDAGSLTHCQERRQ